MSRARVRDLLAALEAAVPASWAEPWDRVGLLAGDPDAPCGDVLVSLDPTPEALGRAIASSASVLLTHHPAYLEPQAPLPAAGLSGVPFRAVASGVALVAAHTNLDRSPEGADALPRVLGLTVEGPLESGLQPVETIVTYVPRESADAVRAAIAGAGGGRIGRYEGCSYSSDGEGRYTPLAGSDPLEGRVGEPALVGEVRVEAVCRSGAGATVAAAVRAVHPYDEPVIMVVAGAIDRGAARMGRICRTERPRPLAEFAETVGDALGVRATVWGEPEARIERVATAPGSGRSLVPFAHAANVDALVTGELRYHEALEARASGLAVIEAGHDATEWPMVPVLAEIARRTGGLAAESVHVDLPRVAWWTSRGA